MNNSEQFKEMRVEGRKTLFSALVDCAKGFLTADERDWMANFIQPDPAPLPPVTTTATPVVTTARGMPLIVVSQTPITTVPISLPVSTTAIVVTATVTPVTTTPTVAITTVALPVTSAAPVNITPQGVVSSAQQTVSPVVEAMGTITTVTASGVSVTSQAPSTVAFSVLPCMSGAFPSTLQSRPVVETSITPSGDVCPVSHPIVIQPSNQRPPPGIIMGVEGLTLPLDPAATVTATVAQLVDPTGYHTLLQGLASHQAAIATSQVGRSTTTTILGTIHGPGLPGPITAAGGSTKPVVSASTSQGERSNIFMVVEDDNIVEVGTARGFTNIVKPKKERTDPPSIPPCTSRG